MPRHCTEMLSFKFGFHQNFFEGEEAVNAAILYTDGRHAGLLTQWTPLPCNLIWDTPPSCRPVFGLTLDLKINETWDPFVFQMIAGLNLPVKMITSIDTTLGIEIQF